MLGQKTNIDILNEQEIPISKIKLSILSIETICNIKNDIERSLCEQKTISKPERKTKYGVSDPKERAKLYLKTYTERHPEYIIAQRERAKKRYYRIKEIKAKETQLELINKEIESRSVMCH